MNHENGWQKKFRHGSIAFGITAAVLAAVLLLNVAMTALCSGNLWYIDLSPEAGYNVYFSDTEQKKASMYTLMDETVSYMDYIINEANQNREEPVEVEIIFCMDPDLLVSMEMMRYVYYTALNLQKEFPDTIKVTYRDVWNNPSSVDMYRSTSYSNIYQTNVIIASGSEFRVTTVRAFYTYDAESGSDTPVGYNGQKWFVKQILDVTGADAPICCLTTNHGEPFAGWELSKRDEWPEYRELMNVIEGAGYEIRFLDLSKEEIPENCRLILTFDPQKDFESTSQNSALKESETVRLNGFLEKAYSFMVFVDADTPELPNLEEYLELWGIELMHKEGTNEQGETVNGNYKVTDPAHGLTSGGESFVGQYVPGRGLGYAVLTDILSSSTSPKIYFENATTMKYSHYFDNRYVVADEKTGAEAYTFGYYEGNGSVRAVYDMFSAGSKDSMAQYSVVHNGKVLNDEEGTPIGGSDVLRLMTIARESRTVAEGQGYTNIDQSSYVCAVGSTSFATDAVLGTTAYGNTDALLATLRYIGKEVNPVGLSFVHLYFPTMDSDSYQTIQPNTNVTEVKPAIITATVMLAVVPAVLMMGAGIFVLVRRKVRH